MFVMPVQGVIHMLHENAFPALLLSPVHGARRNTVLHTFDEDDADGVPQDPAPSTAFFRCGHFP